MGFLIIITGAVMMLIAIAFDWYKLNFYGHKMILDFNDLLNNPALERRFEQDLSWYGTSLPLILIIAFASAAILSAVYALASGRCFKQLWGWLGLLSVTALIANFLCFRYVAIGEDCTPQIGWGLALIGAVAIGIGAIMIGIGNKKKSLS